MFIRTAVDDVRYITQEDREQYEERAAILEYDAGMTRCAAEAMARELVYGSKQLEMFDDRDKRQSYKRRR